MITPITKIQILNFLKEIGRKDPAQREYIDLTKKDCSTNNLKKLLIKLNIFIFNETNSGEYRIGVSQIISYLGAGGYKAHTDLGITISKETYGVHHLDGDVTNNSPNNLVYLSTDDHKLVTEIQNGYLDVNAWCPEETAGIKTQFNRQGRLIKNHTAFLKLVVAKTILMTQRFVERVAAGKTKVKSFKAVQEWVSKTLGKVFNYTGLVYIAEELKPRTLTPNQAALQKETGLDIMKTLITMAVLKRPEPKMLSLAIASTDNYTEPNFIF